MSNLKILFRHSPRESEEDCEAYDRRYPGRDSNRAFHENKSGDLMFRSTFSVTRLYSDDSEHVASRCPPHQI